VEQNCKSCGPNKKLWIGEQKGKFRNKQFVKLIFENKRSKNKNNREQNKSPGTKILIVLVLDNMRNKSF
jgi:hypothetical protein